MTRFELGQCVGKRLHETLLGHRIHLSSANGRARIFGIHAGKHLELRSVHDALAQLQHTLAGAELGVLGGRRIAHDLGINVLLGDNRQRIFRQVLEETLYLPRGN